MSTNRFGNAFADPKHASMDDSPSQNGFRVQLKREVAGLSYEEQQKRLAPPSPPSSTAVQLKEDPGAEQTGAGGGGDPVIEGGVVTIRAATVNIEAPLTNVSGMISADAITADAVIAQQYSPGAGNVW